MSAAHPNIALIALTTGVLLIYVELNRPGRIIPGAVGLLITLLAIPSLDHATTNTIPASATVLFVAVFTLGLRRDISPSISAIATLALIAGFHAISDIYWINAILCGLILGVASSVLVRIARRARLNKGLD